MSWAEEILATPIRCFSQHASHLTYRIESPEVDAVMKRSVNKNLM